MRETKGALPESWPHSPALHFIHSMTKVSIVKVVVFPVVMYECESWTIKRLSAKELLPSNCGAGEDS